MCHFRNVLVQINGGIRDWYLAAKRLRDTKSSNLWRGNSVTYFSADLNLEKERVGSLKIQENLENIYFPCFLDQ